MINNFFLNLGIIIFYMNLIIRLFQKIVFILSYLNKNNLNEKSVLKNFKIQPGIVFDVGSNTGSNHNKIFAGCKKEDTGV